jgi:cell division protein FtsZ
MDIGLEEVETAANLVQEAAHPEANIIFGAAFDENLEDELRVTVIATGFEEAPPKPAPPPGFREIPKKAPAANQRTYTYQPTSAPTPAPAAAAVASVPPIAPPTVAPPEPLDTTWEDLFKIFNNRK